MGDTSLLVSAMIFGSIGLGFYIYGKRQKAKVPLYCGIALFIFPYFVSNIYTLIAVGFTLVALPFFVKI
jgi:predicted membrane protein